MIITGSNVLQNNVHLVPRKLCDLMTTREFGNNHSVKHLNAAVLSTNVQSVRFGSLKGK